MATSKTGSFILSETVSMTASAGDGSRFTGTLDTGPYVNIGTKQALAVESVDFIFQNGSLFDSNVEAMVAANGSLGIQVTDLNPGGVFVQADDNSLIASGVLNIDQANNIASHSNDMFPDNFGSLSDAHMVIGDSIHLVAGNDGTAVGSATVRVTARLKCRIVKLSEKDLLAMSIQRSAVD